jgi:hypothetical protein
MCLVSKTLGIQVLFRRPNSVYSLFIGFFVEVDEFVALSCFFISDLRALPESFVINKGTILIFIVSLKVILFTSMFVN